MKQWRLLLAALLVSCGLTLSPTLLQDGELAVTALSTLNDDAKLLGAPSADVDAIGTAITGVQTALADLKKGIKTPQDFATAVNDQISVLAPILLTDIKANTTIRTGVVLLQQLVLVIGAEVIATNHPPTARQIDIRSELNLWVEAHGK